MLSHDPFDDHVARTSPARGNGRACALGVSLRWHSAEGSHLDSRVLRCPAPETTSSGLRRLLETDSAGKLTRAFAAGELLPDWRVERLVTVPGGFFQRKALLGGGARLRVEPRVGRFYPGSLVAGAPGLPPGPPTAFRIASIAADGEITVDFNHPLAGMPLELTLRKLDPIPAGEAPSDVGRAAVMDGPGMQARWRGQPTDFQSGNPYARTDPEPDADFYAEPRMVQHLDEVARAHLVRLYQSLLPEQGDVLDLMSSWTSHLHAGPPAWRVAGLGMNAKELAANPILDERVVQDLNAQPQLPWPDARFDAVICTVSVEYLIRPTAVFREVRRVLRPGGRFVVTFSNRWFPPKAIALWAQLHAFERMGLVLDFFQRAGGFDGLHTRSLRGLPRPATDPYADRLVESDPLYAVWGEVRG